MTKKMKKLRFLLALLLIFQVVQTLANNKIPYPGGHYYIYRVQLRDKRGSAFSLKHPEAFLSAKALERRSRQGLKVDSSDLPVSAKYIQGVTNDGFEVVGKSKWNNTLLVKVSDTLQVRKLLSLNYVTCVTKVFTSPDSIPAQFIDSVECDTSLAHPAKNPYGRGQQQIDLLNGEKLHAAGFRGQGMFIAIIDGGFMNADKISLLSHVRVLGHRDCVYPYTADVFRLLDHGTMVLSTMAARSEGAFVGTAPQASYYLLRSEDGRSENLVEEDYWAQAAELADSLGADVVNSSLGYTRFDDSRASHRYAEQDGRSALISRTASRMADKGMILVNSAGNEGNNTWKRINFPGDATDILTVAALTADSVNARFSSVGPSIDGRVKPDVSAMGYHSTVIRGDGLISFANGTSFASPELCGMVACLWQALPHKTAREIMSLVRRAADRWDHPDNVYGYGIPDFWKAYQMGQ